MAQCLASIAFLTALAAPLAAQALGDDPELKDPQTARQYAYYFAGAGHFYTGEPLYGGALLGATAVGLYKMMKELGCSAASRAVFSDVGCSRSRAILWLGLAAGSYAFGIADAPKSAARVNARIQGQSRSFSLIPHLDLDHDGRPQAGLHLQIRY